MMISGGARGADTYWAYEAQKHGIPVTHYVVTGATQSNSIRLSAEILETSVPTLYYIAPRLHKPYPCRYKEYLQRDVIVACSVDSLYAVGKCTIHNGTFLIEGGTGWTIEAFKVHKVGRPLFFYDQGKTNRWYSYLGNDKWETIEKPPKPSGIWGGIGSRDLQENGCRAIETVFE